MRLRFPRPLLFIVDHPTVHVVLRLGPMMLIKCLYFTNQYSGLIDACFVSGGGSTSKITSCGSRFGLVVESYSSLNCSGLSTTLEVPYNCSDVEGLYSQTIQWLFASYFCEPN